jgi:hypothetical protein
MSSNLTGILKSLFGRFARGRGSVVHEKAILEHKRFVQCRIEQALASFDPMPTQIGQTFLDSVLTRDTK